MENRSAATRFQVCAREMAVLKFTSWTQRQRDSPSNLEKAVLLSDSATRADLRESKIWGDCFPYLDGPNEEHFSDPDYGTLEPGQLNEEQIAWQI